MSELNDGAVSWVDEDGALVVNMRNMLLHTREIMERLQFDLDVGVSFTDIASAHEIAVVIDSGGGVLWANHIAMFGAEIINANYEHRGAFGQIPSVPPHHAKSIYPLEAWETARVLINTHVAGFSKNVVSDGMSTHKETHAVLMTTYHMFAWKVAILNKGGYKIPRP